MSDGPFITDAGPSAVGAYPHLHRVGDLLFVSGMGLVFALLVAVSVIGGRAVGSGPQVVEVP